MSEKSSINYIFFLKTTSDLSPVFFRLAEIFQQLNIVLVPVSVEEMRLIERHKKHYMIVLRSDLLSAQVFNDLRAASLDLAMSSGHVVVYDLSSFSEIENAAKLQHKKSYFYFPLPVDLKQVAMNIVIDYFKARNEMEEWPGGKRSKLPIAVYENKNE